MPEKGKIVSLRYKLFILFLGIIISIICLECGLRLAGSILLQLQSYRNKIKDNFGYRILCLGDSFTYGVGAPWGKDYPYQLEQILNERYPDIKFEVFNRGVPGGYECEDLVELLEQLADKYEPQMMVLMLRRHEYEWADILKNSTDSRLNFKHFLLGKLRSSLEEMRVYKLINFLFRNLPKKGKKVELKNFKVKIEDIDKESECFSEQGKRSIKIQKLLKEAIRLNSEDKSAYEKLGKYYLYQGKYKKASRIYERALRIAPDAALYGVLGKCYRYLGRYIEAENAFRKAIELNFGDSGVYRELGNCFSVQNKCAQAVYWYEKCLQIDPVNEKGWVELGYLYRKQASYDKAEKVYKKVIEYDPKCNFAYGQLAQCYSEQKNYKQAQLYYQKFSGCEDARIKFMRDNFEKIYRIICLKNIKLILMSYPLCSAEELRAMAKNKINVFVVDNEGVFKEALKNARWEEYFVPDGHCNGLGYKLIALNAAKIIDEIIFIMDKREAVSVK